MKNEKDLEGYDYYDAGSVKIRVKKLKEKKRKDKIGRHWFTVIFIVMIFAGFIGILYNAQIVHGEEYEKNGASTVEKSSVKATRGEILDRNGTVLVGNRQANSIIFDAAEFPSSKEQGQRNEIILSLINLFEKNEQEWKDELPIELDEKGNYVFKEDSEHDISVMLGEDMLDLNRYATADNCMDALIEKYELENYSKSDARKIASVCYQMRLNVFNKANPYIFADDVDDITAAYIKDCGSVYKGVDVSVSAFREYYDGTLAPHLLGMVGPIDAQEYEKLKLRGYKMNDVVGKSGIELAMEDYLKGSDGEKTVTTSADGTVSTEFTKELVNGNNVVLTIDSGLQKVLQDSLKSKCRSIGSIVPHGGAAVVLNCNTGEVLACASYPTYDINEYSENYKELAEDKASPLWNRAFQSVYAPGSTSKPSVALAALEEGAITENDTFTCYHSYKYLDMTFHCIAPHKTTIIDVRTALQDSCNIFFYKVGEKLGAEKMNTYRQLLGLGQPTGIELSENIGVLDSPSYRTSIGQTWMPGFTLQSAIGQAGNLFSPLQLANYCATIANGGTRYSVHLVKEIKNFDLSETVLKKEPEPVVQTGISEKSINIVKQGMRRVVLASPALNNRFKNVVSCAAKTGTSEVEHKVNGRKYVLNNGFFITFAPFEKPEIAVCVAIEGAKSGTSVSSVASDVYDYYFNGKVNDVKEEEQKQAEQDTEVDVLLG
ncbi:MAG: hypothetical protein IJU45_02405 [Clostridia bacterium]|nr:hypothetical protein [Clostridia bacterium]